MFTGLVEEIGTVKNVILTNGGKEIIIYAKKVIEDVKVGDSILVNGACQTVVSFDDTSFKIFSVPETLEVTNLNLLQETSLVNLERALRPIDRIGGHIVQGHIENKAIVKSIEKHENYWNIYIQYKSQSLLHKGSVTLDGISLTIHEIKDDIFRVQIIPETIIKTNITTWYNNYEVNIETDYLIKAIQTMYQDVKI